MTASVVESGAGLRETTHMSLLRRLLLAFACCCLVAQQSVALAPAGCKHGERHGHASATVDGHDHAGHGAHGTHGGAPPAVTNERAGSGQGCDCGCPCVANACAQAGALFALPASTIASAAIARLDAPAAPHETDPEVRFPTPLLRPPIRS